MSGRPESPPPLLHVVPDPGTVGDRLPATRAPDGGDPGSDLLTALRVAEERAQAIANRLADVRLELDGVRAEISRTGVVLHAIPDAGRVIRAGVGALLVALFGLAMWARAVDYPLRVTSDTPTCLALLGDMAEKPFASQSPFLEGGGGTQALP